MGQLRAAIDGCEVVVDLGEDAEVGDDLRDALAELAEAMYEERVPASEVEGFGLTIGDLGLRASRPGGQGVRSCWGYSDGRHCTWFSQTEEERPFPGAPDSCTVYSVTKD